jgi:hypothetical protein
MRGARRAERRSVSWPPGSGDTGPAAASASDAAARFAAHRVDGRLRQSPSKPTKLASNPVLGLYYRLCGSALCRRMADSDHRLSNRTARVVAYDMQSLPSLTSRAATASCSSERARASVS